MIRVLVVDDEPATAAAHAAYLGRLDGFASAGEAHSAAEAYRAVRERDVDVILLDLQLPDASGLELARRLRAEGNDVDIVAVTASRDPETVRSAVALGIVQYLIKPFGFRAFRERLERIERYRAELADSGGAATQSEVDALLTRLHRTRDQPLPKGLASETLDAVVAAVRNADRPLSSSEAAGELELSRVTARRYLEHLVEIGLVERGARHGGAGRPEVAYRWAGAGD